MADVKVLGAWASPYVMRPRIALNLKSVDYEFLEETFGSMSQLLLRSNPVHKKMPVLLHAGNPVSESLIIIEYIDETWSAPSILPSDPYDRATARFWAAYVDDKLFPSMRGVSASQGEDEKKAAVEQVVEGLVLLEGAFQRMGKGGDFFGGDEIGLVDIALGSFMGWIKLTERTPGVKLLDQDKTPGLLKWSKSFCSHDAVKSVMPETDMLVKLMKG